MANLTQSSANVTTTAPQYYTDYLSNLASKGTAAGAAVDPTAWNAQPLQTKAFETAAANVGSYKPGLATAGATLGQAGATDISGAANPYLTAGTTTSGLAAAQPNLAAGTSSAADLVGGYMNPYTKSVVDQIRLANQQNIQQNLSPGITSGAVGGGQFGSKRGAEALALGISNADIGALTAQTGALQSGYADALKAAQQQRANQLTAGQTAGTLQNQANINEINAGQIAGTLAGQQGQLYRDVGTAQAGLAGQTQALGINEATLLSTLGQQQQAIEQNKALMPLDVLGKQAGLMQGAQIPMSTSQTMNASPLSTIASLGSAALGMITPGDGGVAPYQAIANAWDKFTSPSSSASSTTVGDPNSPNYVGPPTEAPPPPTDWSQYDVTPTPTPSLDAFYDDPWKIWNPEIG